MVGTIVASHNNSEVLGLKYLRLAEMESYFLGQPSQSNIAFSPYVRIFKKNIFSVITDILPSTDDKSTKVVPFTKWSQNRMYKFAQRTRNVANDEFGSTNFVRRDVVEDKRPHQETLTRLSVMLYATWTRTSMAEKVETAFLFFMHAVKPPMVSRLTSWILFLFEEAEMMDDHQLQLFWAHILLTNKNVYLMRNNIP